MPDALAYAEAAVAFPCAGEVLHGVLAQPAAPRASAAVGVLIVVGGPQYRIGSHRQFVLLARQLAAHGHAVLRFDVRGMGESSGAQRGFEALNDDIAAGIGMLMQVDGVERVALWGLCDGASASLLYLDATADPRVAGVALLNPWARSPESLARTHVKHYYRERLMQPAFWGKLLRGGVGLPALRELGANALRALRRGPGGAALSFQQRMARAWGRFDGDILVLLSEQDWTAREFQEHLQQSADWQDARQHPRLRWEGIAGADHTFAVQEARLRVEALTVQWLQKMQLCPSTAGGSNAHPTERVDEPL
jgi:exosortase A-associated hydrolase 1